MLSPKFAGWFIKLTRLLSRAPSYATLWPLFSFFLVITLGVFVVVVIVVAFEVVVLLVVYVVDQSGTCN